MDSVVKKYIDTSVTNISFMYPDLKKSEIREIVTRETKKRIRDPSIHMDNNVTGENHDITLTGLCKWIDRENPVVSGNATFYCQPEILESPTSNMLRSLKVERKEVKTAMFQLDPESPEYADGDLDQKNKKVVMNADYGGSGTKTAAFYTEYSPAATTLMAQSIITTMAAFFEGFVGDNQKFFSISECFDWMNKVCQKDQKIPKWVHRPTAKEVATRIKRHFYLLNRDDIPYIDAYVYHCNEDQLVYLYYANNLNEFVATHEKLIQDLRMILSSLPLYEAATKEVPETFKKKFPSGKKGIQEYNKWISNEMFLNPYKIPPCIEKSLQSFMDDVIQFVYVEYLTPDSIVKLNNHMRNTVLLVDTDSNIINADLFVRPLVNQVFYGETFGRTKLYNEMILVNVLAATLSKPVEMMLDYYGRMHHMGKKARKELTMKNEFLFRRFFLMKKKKRYAASIALREGNINIPFKLEIKGVDFIKSGVTEDVRKKFTSFLEQYILFSDDLELHELMRALKKFEKEIYYDLKAGYTKYLKPQVYKEEGAYKKIKDKNGKLQSGAWRLQVFRGVQVWNELFPDQRINSLDRVKIIKTTVRDERDLDVIKEKYPEIYNSIVTKIFHSDNAQIQKTGLKVICIPNEWKQMPEWIVPLVDRHIIVSDVIGSFRSILDALNLEDVYFKTPNGKASITSCMISV